MSSSVTSVSDAPHDRGGWPSGREPGREVVALGFALTLTAVSVDLLLSGSLSLFFDLSFVVACLLLAWAVRPDDFFTVGVLPPLMMLGVFALAGWVAPGLIAHPADGVAQAVVSGLSLHAGALVGGYLLALASLAYRARRLDRPVDDIL